MLFEANFQKLDLREFSSAFVVSQKYSFEMPGNKSIRR
jgi:hypothetical protein